MSVNVELTRNEEDDGWVFTYEDKQIAFLDRTTNNASFIDVVAERLSSYYDIEDWKQYARIVEQEKLLTLLDDAKATTKTRDKQDLQTSITEKATARTQLIKQALLRVWENRDKTSS